MQAIWKDIFVDLTDELVSGKVDYSINDGDGAVIYSGRAFADGDGNCVVRINGILKDYLRQELPAFGTANAISSFTGATLDYSVQTANGEVASDTVVYDYSYDTLANTANFPVAGRIDRRLPLVWTHRSLALLAVVTKADGTTTQVPFTLSGGPRNIYFYTPQYTNAVSVAFGSLKWQIVDTCARYALYYVNAAGGWDVLLLEGNTRLVETYTRETFGRDYDNGDPRAAGVIVNRNDIARRWQLQTGWLRESEAARMHHVLGTTQAFLCDMEDGNALTPVVLKTDTIDVRRHGNGAAAAKQYTIEAEEARERVRR